MNEYVAFIAVLPPIGTTNILSAKMIVRIPAKILKYIDDIGLE